MKKTPEEMEREAKEQEEELQKLLLVNLEYEMVLCTFAFYLAFLP